MIARFLNHQPDKNHMMIPLESFSTFHPFQALTKLHENGAIDSKVDEKNVGCYTPGKFNSEFTPQKWWLEDDPFLLGFGNFSGDMLNFRGGMFLTESRGFFLVKLCKICSARRYLMVQLTSKPVDTNVTNVKQNMKPDNV